MISPRVIERCVVAALIVIVVVFILGSEQRHKVKTKADSALYAQIDRRITQLRDRMDSAQKAAEAPEADKQPAVDSPPPEAFDSSRSSMVF